jgi:hypothetical protein
MMYLVLPNSFPPPDAKGRWRTLSDPAKIAKTAGVDKQKLDEAFEYVQNTEPARRFAGGAARLPGLRAVLRQGRPRGFCRSWRPCGKAFTSVAVALWPLRELNVRRLE